MKPRRGDLIWTRVADAARATALIAVGLAVLAAGVQPTQTADPLPLRPATTAEEQAWQLDRLDAALTEARQQP